MALAPDATAEPDWRPSVTVVEDAELARELLGRMRPAGRPRRWSVTDVLAPRPAYWRAAVGPPPITPEREAVLEGGRRLHRILGAVFAGDGQLEVRVHNDHLQGRVDVLTDRPIEIKTSAYAPPAEDPLRERPEHADQAAVYASLLGTDRARLVYLQATDDELRATAVYDLALGDLEYVRSAVERRVSELNEARRQETPATLPRCPWYSRGCEFRGASVCDCTGGEPPSPPLVVPDRTTVTSQPETAATLADRLRARLADAPRSEIRRFRDLLYPRRAYFESTPPAEGMTSTPFEPETDTYSRVVEALDAGPVGEATRLPTLADDPDEEVSGFREAPVLVRTSRSSVRIDPQRLVERSPQYALQLGFRCVATGTTRARLVLGYERAVESERIQVLELRFQPVSVFSRVWRHRVRELTAARSAGDPSLVPACPAWMFEGCAYRDRCGCGGASGRSQR